jgi:hypothetical protein
MLEFLRHQKTICGYVCIKIWVPDYQLGEYWDLVRQQATKKMIEQQWTNATSARKKGFKGKYTTNTCKYICTRKSTN